MKNKFSRKLRSVANTCAVFVLGSLVITSTVLAQHDMSKMPGMHKPASKPNASPARKRNKKRSRPRPSNGRPRKLPNANAAPPSSGVRTSTPPQFAEPTSMPGMDMPLDNPSPTKPPMTMPGIEMPATASPAAPSAAIPGMIRPEEQTPASGGKIFVDPDPQVATRPVVRLADLEAMALKNNPTLAQTNAEIRAAEGRRIQAGLYPNPTLGYTMDEFVFRQPGESAKHGAFLEQVVPLGGKLAKSRQVFAREKEQAELLAEAQRTRVLSSVRILFFEALGAQQMIELRGRLVALTREATEISKELHNVGQADTPDQLEIEIETQRAELDLLRADNARAEVWTALAAMVNNPDLKPSPLDGALTSNLGMIDEEQIASTILIESPEIRVAQVGVERARAVLSRAKAQRVPDLTFNGGIAYNFERFEPLVPRVGNQTKGLEGRLQVGINLPIFNRNQGGIAEAEAGLGIAQSELQRRQLLLRSRLASSLRQFRDAQQMEEKYRSQVIPRARAGYEMYLANFRQMAASYPQVLIAQRTLFQVEVEYAQALVRLQQSAISLRGFLLTGGLDATEKPGEPDDAKRLSPPNESGRGPAQ